MNNIHAGTKANASQFDSESASVNGQTIDRSGNKAIADTGTTLCLVSDEVCEAVYQALGGQQSSQQQGYVFPTPDSSTTLPQVSFAVGGQQFIINPQDLAFQDLGDGTSYGGIQSRGNQDFDILGDVFLRSIYAIFDQGNTRFGAVQRQPGASASGTSGSGTSGSN